MANFQYDPPFTPFVPDDQSTFRRSFEHTNWVDGQDVVQAGKTPDEIGFNERLNALETDLDNVRTDLQRSFRLIGELRQQLAAALLQIQDELNRKPDKTKEGKDGKEAKEGKERKEGKEGETKGAHKEGKESKEQKDRKDGKETKEHKEEKDGKEGMNAAEKNDRGPRHDLAPPPMFLHDAGDAGRPEGRAFIRLDERPRVGDRLLARDPGLPAPVPATPAP